MTRHIGCTQVRASVISLGDDMPAPVLDNCGERRGVAAQREVHDLEPSCKESAQVHEEIARSDVHIGPEEH